MIKNFENGVSTLIIMAVVALLLVGAIAITPIINRPPASVSSSPSPIPLGSGIDDQSISLLYLSRGDIELENIKNMPGFLGCTSQNDSSTRCEIRSPLVSRPNLIIVKDGQLLFKRTVTTPLANGRLPSLGNLSSGLGAAGQVQKGSRFFGSQVQTYIFANKGVVLIANPNTGEVQEVQVFNPQSTSEYLTNFGEDIRSYSASTASAF